MFITVDGFNKTGIPSALWDFVEPYSRIDNASGAALLSLVIIVLSNVASNVPTGKICTAALLDSKVVRTFIGIYFKIASIILHINHYQCRYLLWEQTRPGFEAQLL